MLRNYLAAALRNFLCNKLYAAINVTGLAIGFAATLLIALYVRDELSYDKWIPGHERVMSMTATMQYPARTPIMGHRIPAELSAFLKLDFPQIESIARIVGGGISLRRGDVEANETIFWADPEIFDLLRLPVVSGDLSSALKRPDGLVLTRRVAAKYFGDANPVGATMEINREHQMRVAAVIEDLPSNTHLNAEIFGSGLATFSFLSLRDANPASSSGWQSNTHTYLRLTPGASAYALEQEMPAFLERHKKDTLKNFEKIVLRLTPLAALHMLPDNSSTALKPPTALKTLFALAAIGAFILLIANINFINLMTARASRRAIEVGVRKVSGAEQRNLIAQFLGESLAYAAVSAAVAGVAIELLLPRFNAFLDRGIAFDYMHDPALSAAILVVVLVVGVLAGFYPAFVLSAFRPAAGLKSQIKRGSAGRVRQALVVVQFAILIGLIISVGVVYRQSVFALTEGLRLDKDQVIVVRTTCQNSFPDRVRALPGVRAAACADRNGLTFGTANGAFTRAGYEPVTLSNHITDFGYLELYGFTPLAGRFFSRDVAEDSVGAFNPAKDPVGPNLVINETAVRRFGFTSPADAVGQTLGISTPGFVARFQIIGVVRDFSFDSVHSLIQPSMYFVGPGTQWLHVKLSGSDLPTTLEAIDDVWKESGEPRPILRLFLDQELEKVYLDIRRQSQLFGGFSAVAVFIAILGLFGLSAFIAEQRTKEIGIRKSMGASSADVLRLLLWQFTKPVLWANVVAWPAAYFVMRRWLDGFAYHVDLSPWIFLGATVATLVIALATVIGHALMVARAHPVTALRYE